ncbi:MAG: carboxymuconolactone decarboxylase family protein [Nitrospinaceae bacterium]|nr:carboxymuconolactone decarboxylase family protein [Nitrospinaceae bacterium]
MDSPHLSPRERAAVLWAEHVTLNTAKARDDVFEEVHRLYSDAEVVELTMVITYFNMRNRFQDALRIPLETDGRVERISKSLHQKTDDMKNYFAGLAENWPEEFPQATEE